MKPLPLALLLALLIGTVIHLSVRVFRPTVEDRHGGILHETRSDFSHIRVREKGTVRSLHFVDEDGAEQCQSSLDLAAPGRLQLNYTRGLFASLLFVHPQRRVLVVGLGGGGMVRFLGENFPSTRVGAVEIDPVVVRLAGEFFGVREGPTVELHTADAFHFFEGEGGRFDAIYLDAFLRAPEATGLGERTARLKTRGFLEQVRDHLEAGGVVAFNLIAADPRTPEDLSTIREVFPGAVRFRVPGSGNLVVVAPRDGSGPTREALIRRGEELDRILSPGFSLAELAENRVD